MAKILIRERLQFICYYSNGVTSLQLKFLILNLNNFFFLFNLHTLFHTAICFLIYKNVSFEYWSYKAVYKLNYRRIFKGNNCYEQKPDKRFNPYRLMLQINCFTRPKARKIIIGKKKYPTTIITIIIINKKYVKYTTHFTVGYIKNIGKIGSVVTLDAISFKVFRLNYLLNEKHLYFTCPLIRTGVCNDLSARTSYYIIWPLILHKNFIIKLFIVNEWTSIWLYHIFVIHSKTYGKKFFQNFFEWGEYLFRSNKAFQILFMLSYHLLQVFLRLIYNK